jgi:hypothetical protein
MEATAVFAATFAALYAGHHVGDYWVQTDHQARHKGDAGEQGVLACFVHVASYTLTQVVFLGLTCLATGLRIPSWVTLAALAVSALTHYAADRREHGLMFKLARLLPGKADFLRLGAPRPGVYVETWVTCPDCKGSGRVSPVPGAAHCDLCHGGGRVLGGRVGDNPSLGTGAWALDQSWHIALGVFVPALIMAAAAR